jgi:hypothetical protein
MYSTFRMSLRLQSKDKYPRVITLHSKREFSDDGCLSTNSIYFWQTAGIDSSLPLSSPCWSSQDAAPFQASITVKPKSLVCWILSANCPVFAKWGGGGGVDRSFDEQSVPHSKSGSFEKHLYQAHITLQLHWYSNSGIIIKKSTSIHMQLRRFHIRSFACALKLIF